MDTGAARCPCCERLVPTYDWRLAYHWPVRGENVFGVPGRALAFGCAGGGTTDATGKAAFEQSEAERLEREAALAAFAAGNHEPLWKISPFEAHVREGGD